MDYLEVFWWWNMEGFIEQILEVVATIIRTYWVGFILCIEGGDTILYKKGDMKIFIWWFWDSNIITTAGISIDVNLSLLNSYGVLYKEVVIQLDKKEEINRTEPQQDLGVSSPMLYWTQVREIGKIDE